MHSHAQQDFELMLDWAAAGSQSTECGPFRGLNYSRPPHRFGLRSPLQSSCSTDFAGAVLHGRRMKGSMAVAELDVSLVYSWPVKSKLKILLGDLKKTIERQKILLNQAVLELVVFLVHGCVCYSS